MQIQSSIHGEDVEFQLIVHIKSDISNIEFQAYSIYEEFASLNYMIEAIENDNITSLYGLTFNNEPEKGISTAIYLDKDGIEFAIDNSWGHTLVKVPINNENKKDAINLFLTIKYFSYLIKNKVQVEDLPILRKINDEDIVFRKPNSDYVIEWLKV